MVEKFFNGFPGVNEKISAGWRGFFRGSSVSKFGFGIREFIQGFTGVSQTELISCLPFHELFCAGFLNFLFQRADILFQHGDLTGQACDSIEIFQNSISAIGNTEKEMEGKISEGEGKSHFPPVNSSHIRYYFKHCTGNFSP